MVRDTELRALRRVIRAFISETREAAERRVLLKALWPQLFDGLDALTFDASANHDRNDLIVQQIVKDYVAEGNTVHVAPPLMPRETRPETQPGRQTRSGWLQPLPGEPQDRAIIRMGAEVHRLGKLVDGVAVPESVTRELNSYPESDYDAPSDLGNER